jgi:hypothetical protein
MSVSYRDAYPGISLHFSGVDQHCQFALSEYLSEGFDVECRSGVDMYPCSACKLVVCSERRA